MKTFSVAVAVAVMLAFICTQESSALPLAGVQELEEPVNYDNGDLPVADHPQWPVEKEKVKEIEDPVGTDNPGAEYEETSVETWMVQELEEPVGTDYPAAEYEETSVETWMMPFNIRGKHQSGPIRCRYCCGCCVLGVCGMCCK
ncbi:hepcidin-like isoform X1 [Plectropomus leopardus]|uniref:hepcidin-like isoform X1 n=1 Tax=Plectropomus leopardus TaxID=160734 RepID=UPI001C4B4782|nr:hepcidin-like isoform X1 [Plectropomus leopardus]